MEVEREKVKMERGSVVDPGLDGGRVGLQRAHQGHEKPFHGGIRVAGAPKQKLGPQRNLFIRRIIVLQEGVKIVHHGPHGRWPLAFRQLWVSLFNLWLLRRALGAPQDHQMGMEPRGLLRRIGTSVLWRTILKEVGDTPDPGVGAVRATACRQCLLLCPAAVLPAHAAVFQPLQA